ncbi:MAG: methyltransferase domain-containing protein [Nannocystaceae bacterium]|nr:methyltransferase domain-containing protein [Nannocystaceae bacterium]
MDDKPQFPADKVDARAAAQAIAFGPLIFQAARSLQAKGVLRFLLQTAKGATDEEVAVATDVSLYAARVLLEAGLVAGIVELEQDRYTITLVGRMLQRDRMTRVNMDFVHDVCFKPAFHLDESLEQGRPVGLQELGGDWPTVYEGLRECSDQVRKSWFAFDHYYSDASYREALDIVFATKPRRILDVGGNTGRFALECCRRDSQVEVVIMDLPGQLRDAALAVSEAGESERVHMHEGNLLDVNVPLPTGVDAIWMSQFLDCFSEPEILGILKRARRAIGDEGTLYIMETLWDRQPNDTARYCVVATSLYFAAVANGNSKMYHSKRLIALAEEAGFSVARMVDGLGLGHTLLLCTPTDAQPAQDG